MPYRLAISHSSTRSHEIHRNWLGYLDSNQGMPVSKTGALPLGDTPSMLPNNEMVREARLELAHLAAPEPKSGASTNFATPAKKDGGYDGNRTCDPSIMSAVL
ncbi:Putative RNA (modular protein) [Pantoea brenneri]|uniref:RNA (Modular protein) n=1 Tax=Pantoea brenneri TaxID=472694 RepID=A0AAX3J8K1_9GAMM|nr:Putative RNA (modular protein) [Pantoea brenneri]